MNIKRMFLAGMVGILTAAAGYPVWSDGRVEWRNVVVLALALVIVDVLQPEIE